MITRGRATIASEGSPNWLELITNVPVKEIVEAFVHYSYSSFRVKQMYNISI